jgi:hypothetical protein
MAPGETMEKQKKSNGNGRKARILSELSVGLTTEMLNLLKFASDNSETPPSIIGRRYIAEGLIREQWPQRAQAFIAQMQAPVKP